MDPAVHARPGVLDVLLIEPPLQIDLIDRIDRTHKVALITERNRGIDSHAAFETSIRRGPFSFTCGHTFGGHKGLSASAGKRIYDVGFWIHPSGETPHDVVHVVGVAIFTDGDDKPRTLRGREDRGHKI